ncbi:hypothetical protein BJY04DRAFT_223798 [Aspergillus karnatakaensis]|uniref:uncharacterized protein n=1 Tax=Aspergillus karnatakaensis TaxID=1810916 RepID=UPI003CCE4D88
MSSAGQQDNAQESPPSSPKAGPKPESTPDESVTAQLRDMTEVLKEIRSQLADQNSYLKSVTEKPTKATSQKSRTIYIAHKEWSDKILPLHEKWHRSRIPNNELLKAFEIEIFRLLKSELDGILTILTASKPNYEGREGSLNIGSIETLESAWPEYEGLSHNIDQVATNALEDSSVDFSCFFLDCAASCRLDSDGSLYQTLGEDTVRMHKISINIGYPTDSGSTSTNLAQMTRENRRRLMFDDNNFSKSDQYFAALQTMHICTDWIKGSLRDFRVLCEDTKGQISRVPGITDGDEDMKSFKELCDDVLANSERDFQPLLDRIERKVEEVKGLRDGVRFPQHPDTPYLAPRYIYGPLRDLLTLILILAVQCNLRQGSFKGTNQNRYILVFTVATVFYLPMGFVTSFFGMHLFDPNDDPSASRRPFIITFVVIAVATYVIAASALFVIREDAWIKTTIAGWKRSVAFEFMQRQWSSFVGMFSRRKEQGRADGSAA